MTITSQDRQNIERAAQAAAQEDPPRIVRNHLLSHDHATLCTLSREEEIKGYPFGSVVPFALTEDGRPVILIANFAQHTQNMIQDPRASLFVQQPPTEDDPQAGWRITVIGNWREITDPEEHARVHPRYLERVRAAESYFKTHRFAYWVMQEVRRVRYIGGFGKICWVEGKDIVTPARPGELEAAVPGAISHMNEDHRENMREMCKGLYDIDPKDAEMVELDRAGFLLKTTEPDKMLWFSFQKEIDASSLRHEVVQVLVRARAAKS